MHYWTLCWDHSVKNYHTKRFRKEHAHFIGKIGDCSFAQNLQNAPVFVVLDNGVFLYLFRRHVSPKAISLSSSQGTRERSLSSSRPFRDGSQPRGKPVASYDSIGKYPKDPTMIQFMVYFPTFNHTNQTNVGKCVINGLSLQLFVVLSFFL